jgi:hypothetical protein
MVEVVESKVVRRLAVSSIAWLGLGRAELMLLEIIEKLTLDSLTALLDR